MAPVPDGEHRCEQERHGDYAEQCHYDDEKSGSDRFTYSWYDLDPTQREDHQKRGSCKLQQSAGSEQVSLRYVRDAMSRRMES